MRRLVLASLAFLLLFLPFQAGKTQARPESCCGGCSMPVCPPKCPTPPRAPTPLPPGLVSEPIAAIAVESEARRVAEPSPAPAALLRANEPMAAVSPLAIPVATGPPDRSDAQAFLKTFRI